MKKTFIIQWNRDDYGNILINAETAEEAKELFLSGEYSEKDMNIKGGDTTVFQVDEIK